MKPSPPPTSGPDPRLLDVFARLMGTGVAPAQASPSAGQRLAVGTDIVWIPAVAESFQQFGERYLKRLFTPQELRHCQQSATTPDASLVTSASAWRFDRLAARFAAKEAAIKLLRPSADSALPWTSMEVLISASGAPQLRLTGHAAALAGAAGLQQLCLSLSHDRDYATATVVALSRIESTL